MSKATKDKVLSTVLDIVLPQQVPDAKVLLGDAALERFGLLLAALAILPDIVAYSEEHNTLFFIQAATGTGGIDDQRYLELEHWSSAANCHIAFVSAFASRKAYAECMKGTASNTHIWFADAPKHSAYLSNSVEDSTQILEARIAARAATL
ncbi:MAG: BsuBI/PstI family type II restriction endonuclease [Flavobacteriales bacterium]|nr:hypothetical protein [Flavobacteriales bacterium]